MSVIGIDFGNESCYVAAAKAGGIETLANDYSLRATPSCVAFAGKKRILGVAAKNQMVTNLKNTISGFKRLLGRKYNDPHVQRELPTLPYRVEQRPDGGIGIRVNYLDEEHVFSPEQITAMLFTKLKETASAANQVQVNDCVIAVPVYYTNAERQALLDAAQIGGLNVLRLLNETTAVALSYGFYKQDLPAPEEKPRNVIFVDIGNASMQVSACAFNKGKLKMISSSWDQVGGRDIDYILADHFNKEFQTKYKINAKTNPRAYLRLLTEVEKLKKQMSANSTKLPLNIECLVDETDVTSSMQRVDMEEMCAHLFKRIEATLKKCLQDSKLSQDEIHSVEIVGGSTRIPAVKHLIEQIYNKPASTTLNQDEAVSRGAALQCAIMSPAVRVRDFGVTDIQNYAVKVSWDGEGNQMGELEVFPAFHAAPFSRLLTLYRREPFNMKVLYAEQIPYPDQFIGQWHVKDVKPNAAGESQEVKVKVRINTNGLVTIASASIIEKKEEETTASHPDNGEIPEPMEGVQEDSGDEKANHHQSPKRKSNDGSSEGPGWGQRVMGWFSSGGNDEQKKDKKKKLNKMIELPLEFKTHGFARPELENYCKQESKMINKDQEEKERIDARNALEEYVYDMRDKCGDGGSLAEFIGDHDRSQIVSDLHRMEEWLYEEEGEICDKEMYKSKLDSLCQRIDPAKMRAAEFEQQPYALEELSHALQMARKGYDEIQSGQAKYDHISEAEKLNIQESVEKHQRWLDEARLKINRQIKTAEPLVKVTDIRNETRSLTACVNSVLNRPKPKPPTPQPTPEQQQPSQDEQKQANNDGPTISEEMEVE